MTDTPPVVRALAAALGQLADLVAALTDDQYTRQPAAAGSAVGGHVRHNLDHVDALLRGLRTGHLDYDRRERGTAVERDRGEAVAAG
ncbi:MAG: DinB family protein [Gemmataceae bacterium]|nr:DinB family protein [Gemmataceae bacterium]